MLLQVFFIAQRVVRQRLVLNIPDVSLQLRLLLPSFIEGIVAALIQDADLVFLQHLLQLLFCIQKAGGVIGGVIGIASIVFAMAVVVFSGVSVKLTGTALELSGGIGDRASIPYTEITGVEWRDVFDKGSRTWGTGTGKISSGTFTNDEFGAYRLYLHNRVRCAVVVRHGADETTVFNGETEEKTKEVYEELASRAKT